MHDTCTTDPLRQASDHTCVFVCSVPNVISESGAQVQTSAQSPLDGVNPCAMWVLLSVRVRQNDRRRVMQTQALGVAAPAVNLVELL